MKTFVKTFNSYVEYVQNRNHAIDRQFNVVDTDRGCEYVAFGERFILVDPSEHEVFEQSKFENARVSLIGLTSAGDDWMRGLELAHYKQSWIYWAELV